MANRSGAATGLTENNIHIWVGEVQFNRGLQYVHEGLVIPQSHRRQVVRGWCLPRAGQRGFYHVWARFQGLRIRDAHCTCPLGKYGICPHVAAVLVAFTRSPRSFRRSLWQRMLSLVIGHKAVTLPVSDPADRPVKPNQVA